MNDQQGPDFAAIKAEILALHQEEIEAHLNADVDFFVRDLNEEYLSISRGEIQRPTQEEILARFDSYLNNTKFTAYEDLCEPVVSYSADGSVAWSIVQVRVAGVREMPDGQVVEFDHTWAWITLYRRVEDRWVRLLEVSNAKQTA